MAYEAGGRKVFLDVQAPTPEIYYMFDAKMKTVLVDIKGFEEEIQEIKKKQIHIYVDVSNISLGAFKAVVGSSPSDEDTPDPFNLCTSSALTRRINISNLMELVTSMRTVARKVINLPYDTFVSMVPC